MLYNNIYCIFAVNMFTITVIDSACYHSSGFRNMSNNERRVFLCCLIALFVGIVCLGILVRKSESWLRYVLYYSAVIPFYFLLPTLIRWENKPDFNGGLSVSLAMIVLAGISKYMKIDSDSKSSIFFEFGIIALILCTTSDSKEIPSNILATFIIVLSARLFEPTKDAIKKD